MKINLFRIACVVVAVTLVSLVGTSRAVAQYPVPVAQYSVPVAEYPVVAAPVTYTSVQPEVVGYQFEWRGLLGLRSRWNPVVAPVARTVVTPPITQPVPVYSAVPTVVPTPVPTMVTPVEPVNQVMPVTYETVYQVRY